jgi:hypothetical protein
LIDLVRQIEYDENLKRTRLENSVEQYSRNPRTGFPWLIRWIFEENWLHRNYFWSIFRTTSSGQYLPQLTGCMIKVALGAQNISYATEVVEKQQI